MAFCLVLEDDPEHPALADRHGEHVEPAAHGVRSELEPQAPRPIAAGGCHPMRLEVWNQLECGTLDRFMKPGHLLEQRVGVEEPIVDQRAGIVDDDLAEAIASSMASNSSRKRPSSRLLIGAPRSRRTRRRCQRAVLLRRLEGLRSHADSQQTGPYPVDLDRRAGSSRAPRFRILAGMTGDFDDLLAANRVFASSFALSGFDGLAHAGVAVVTCMDSRIDPLGMLGLAPGDAKIFRNPGGRVTQAALEALVLGAPAQCRADTDRAAHPVRGWRGSPRTSCGR